MNHRFDLTGKTILVCGASSGLGKQIALTLSEAGAQLIITGRNRERLAETLSLLEGKKQLSFACDLTSEEQRNDLISHLPALDGVVYAAGTLQIISAKMCALEDIRETQAVNYEAPVLLMQRLLEERLLKEKSAVVFLTSVIVNKASKGFGLYAGSKGALTAYARVLALEVAAQGIRVNCLAPGMVRTPMYDQSLDMLSAEQMKEHEKQYPLGFVTPEDVAQAALYLLSDSSAKITGITLTIDGGYSLN